jgi:branched-chain amino acid transport system substrate-binding protein
MAIGAVALSVGVLAACSSGGGGSPSAGASSPADTGPITIGASLSLTPPSGNFTADGQAFQKGYELWASDVNSHGGLNGHPVKLIVMNDEGWPASTEYDYKWLINHDHVDLTLAPFSSLLTALGAVPATKPLHYVLPAGSAGAPSVYQTNDPYLFSTNVPVAGQMLPFAKWVVTLPHHPLTAAYPQVSDPFADPPVDAAETYLQDHQIQTVYTNTKSPYNAAASNNQLVADARAVARHHPGIVLLGSIAVSTVEDFLKGFAQAHFTPQLFIASSGPDQGQAFLDSVGTSNAIGMMVPNGWFGSYPNALSHVMVQDYIAKYGGTASDINADVAESYSAGETVQAAVDATHGTNQQALATWLHSHSVPTVLGAVKFLSDGENSDAANAALIFQWQPGAGGTGAKFVQILPKSNVDSVAPLLRG